MRPSELDIETPSVDYDAEDAPLPEGDLVVLPAPSGRPFSVRFVGAYEPWVALDGARVVRDEGPEHRALLRFVSRHLLPLYRVLELSHALLGTLDGTTVSIRDLVAFEADAGAIFLDHGALRRRLAGSGLPAPRIAILGALTSRNEIALRLRGMYASGTPVEVRTEESGRTVGRRRMIVGR